MPLNERAPRTGAEASAGEGMQPHMVTPMAAFHFDAFDGKKTTWSRWVKRFETALLIFNADSTKKRQLLLHYMGTATYDFLCDKVLPIVPEDMSYENIVQVLEDNFNPKGNEILENYRFHLRKQKSEESCSEFLVALRRLAAGCNFGNYSDTALRNQFVFGLRSQRIQNRLLEKKDLTLLDAVNTAKAYEIAEKEGVELHQSAGAAGVETVNKVQHKRKEKRTKKRTLNTASENKGTKCYRCGSAEHLAFQCSHKETTCHFCKKKGH